MGEYIPKKDESLLLAAREASGPSPWDLPPCLSGPPTKLGIQSFITYHRLVDYWVEECLKAGYVVDTRERMIRNGTALRQVHPRAA